MSHVAVVLKEMWFNFIDPSAFVGRGNAFSRCRRIGQRFLKEHLFESFKIHIEASDGWLYTGITFLLGRSFAVSSSRTKICVALN